MSDSRSRPAYQRIADDIRSQILDGTLRADDRLPSETELIADYGVSRIVVRAAVEVLRSEGLVVKQQGRGSFVRALRPEFRVTIATDTSADGSAARELARILREVADRLEANVPSGRIRDINGRLVGGYSLRERGRDHGAQ